ncbi:MAG: protein kinase [Planctomycetota bacterium]
MRAAGDASSRCLSWEELEAYAALPRDEVHATSATRRAAEHLALCDPCAERADEIRANRPLLDELTRLGPELGRAAEADERSQLADAGYEIVAELHRGGQGVVYEALEGATGQRVAIKMPLFGDYATEAQRRRFRRETEIVRSLRHPNIVRLRENGTTASGQPYLVLELVDGPDLQAWLAEERPSLVERLELFLAVADAVEFAHARGVVHRDLKPSNLLVRDGQPLILDFGLAQRAELGASASLTRSGEFLGSLAWCAPEQVEGDGRRTDARTDVHALGLLLHLLLTERPAYELRGSIADIVRTITTQRAPRPSRHGGLPGVSADLDAIVGQALEKDPRERYATVAELAADVRRALGKEPVQARPVTAWGEARRFVRRHPLAVALVLALSLVPLAVWRAREVELARVSAELAREQIDQGRLLARFDRAVAAEDWIWRHYLAPPGGDPALRDAAEWGLFELYARHPCVRTERLSPGRGHLALSGEAGLIAVSRPEGVEVLGLPGLERRGWLPGEGGHARRPFLSPDGRWLATVLGGELRLGEALGGLARRLGEERVATVSFARGSLYAALADGDVVRWSLEAEPRALERLRLAAPAIALSVAPDGARAITLDADEGEMRLWSLAEERLLARTDAQRSQRLRVDWARGRVLGANRDVVAWSFDDRGFAPPRLMPTAVGTRGFAAFHGDSERVVAAGGVTDNLIVWRLTDEAPVPTADWSGHRHTVLGVEWWARGGLLVSLDSGGFLKLWEGPGEGDEAPGARVLGTLAKSVHAVCFSPDGETLISGGDDEVASLRAWSVAEGRPLDTATSLPGVVSSVACAPDGRGLATASHDGAVRFGPAGRERVLLAPNPEERASFVSFSRDGRWLAAGFDAGRLRAWDAADWSAPPRSARVPNAARISSVAWERTGAVVAAGQVDGALAWWRPASGELRHADERHDGPVRTVAGSPADDRIATGSDDRTVRLWRCGARRPEAVLEGHESGVTAVAFRPPAGDVLASADRSGTVRLWSVADGSELATVRLHGLAIYALDFDPSGRYLATGGEDGTARLFDLARTARHVRGNRAVRAPAAGD